MSWWNPIDDIKSAAKDVQHVASDVVKTGESFAKDAYDTVKTAVKGAATVGSDIVKTTEKVGGDVVHGHFGDALKDTGSGIVQTGKDFVKSTVDTTGAAIHTAVDLGKNEWNTATDVNHLLLDSVSAVNPVLGAGLRLGEVFTESAVNTAILKPIDGLEHLASDGIHALTGYDLPKINLELTPDTQGLGWAGKVAEYAGDAAGFVAPLILTGGATASLVGLSIAGKIGDAAEVASVAGRAGEAVEGASDLSKAADLAGVTSKAADTAGATSEGADAVQTASAADDVNQSESLSSRVQSKISEYANKVQDKRIQVAGKVRSVGNAQNALFGKETHMARAHALDTSAAATSV